MTRRREWWAGPATKTHVALIGLLNDRRSAVVYDWAHTRLGDLMHRIAALSRDDLPPTQAGHRVLRDCGGWVPRVHSVEFVIYTAIEACCYCWDTPMGRIYLSTSHIRPGDHSRSAMFVVQTGAGEEVRYKLGVSYEEA